LALSRCFDLDGNGKHTGHECLGDEERILDVPVDSSAGLPFRWIRINWNPAGHQNTPYAQPHFDFHFHTSDRSRVEAIAPGRCGELVTAAISRSPPGRFRPGTYPAAISTSAPWCRGWGIICSTRNRPNSRIHSRSPSTFIYGAYDGEVIFWEPMITLDLLRNTQDSCLEIRQPEAFQQAGYYPTQYCVRQDRGGWRTVSLERFRYSEAL
jgi:hypothetical protein